MPRRETRRRRAQGGCLTTVIATLAVAALVLVAAIIITNRLGPRNEPAPVPQGTGEYVDATGNAAQEHQLVLKADSYGKNQTAAPEGAAAVTMPPTPEPTAEPTFNPDEPYALVRPQPIGEGYLPLFEKANTEARQIAITVDECSGAAITKEFARAAYDYGAKLTLFPTGENVMKKGMGEVLKNCYYRLGFEIENRCYSGTARLYQINDSMMAAEIWKQSIAVSYVLGIKYQPHFLRLYGGDGENDLRTHMYLIQEGYKGIAGWTINGSRMDLTRIGNNLQPGNIYYFRTCENDLTNMRALLEEARLQGYQMVTLNELFGYDPNETREVRGSLLSETMPELRNHNVPFYFMKTEDCTWATNLVQRRLINLGYLPEGSADGVFGSDTAAALSAFQARLGMAATGAADIPTQERLFSQDAPRNGE